MKRFEMISIAMALRLMLLLLVLARYVLVDGAATINGSPLYNNNLRGHRHNDSIDNNIINRSLHKEDEDSASVILSQPQAFQITMSIILGVLIAIQIVLLTSFIYHRTKRVLEFAQPIVICIFIACSIITSSTCYLFIYTTNAIGCAIREPLIYIFISLMGATIAGRAWRISTIMNNPLNTFGKSLKDVPRIERTRQFMLHVLTLLSGSGILRCIKGANVRGGRGGGRGGGGGGGTRQSPLRVTITFGQMMRTILMLILPQGLLQIVILAIPSLRSVQSIVYTDYYGVIVGQEICQGSTAVSWQLYVSIAFALLPYIVAYLLNQRPRTELEQLPDMIDEREALRLSFGIFIRVLVIAAPVIGLTLYSPAARVYASICLVLGLPLALCYHIAYMKLVSTMTSTSKQRRFSTSSSVRTSTDSIGDKSSAAYALKMAEMYSKIGRTEETIQLVEETLSIFRKGVSSGVIAANIGQSDGRTEVGSGFTKNDLKALEADELQLIIQLLRIKSSAIVKVRAGPQELAMSAQTNIDALKIFEHCPAAVDMKDTTIIFPIYNLVGAQLKGGVIEQDDQCSLESDLAEKYVQEAQTQVFHYARALAYLAEYKGRIGSHEEAFKYFNIMKSIYMPEVHRKLLSKAYAMDKCAICIAISALWYLQKGDIDRAIEQCEYIINEILPSYDKTDGIGLYMILLALIRVLKFNGHVDKVRDVYNTTVPSGIENHFAVGHLHKPMQLLLNICDGNSEQYNTVQFSDVELALNFDPEDMPDKSFMCDGLSMKSMSAEICFHLARRMAPGNADRERLVNRGIEQSNTANERVTTSNGMIKHILAYEGNKEIQIRLIELKREDTTVSRTVIYDNNVHIDTLNSSNCITTTEGSPKTLKKDVSIANRFVVKGDTSKGSNGSSSGAPSSFSAPYHVDTTKKKVAFSHLSSFESHGSRHSENSQSSAQESAPAEDISHNSQLS